MVSGNRAAHPPLAAAGASASRTTVAVPKPGGCIKAKAGRRSTVTAS